MLFRSGQDYVYFKKSKDYDTDGKLLLGWQKISDRLFYFKKSGTNGSNTKKLSGWQKIRGKQYYFHPGTGKLDGYAYRSGTFIIDNAKCTFDKNGVLKKKVIIASPVAPDLEEGPYSEE